MTKNKKKRKGETYKLPPASSNVVDELVQLASEIEEKDDSGPLWGKLHKVLLRSSVEGSI